MESLESLPIRYIRVSEASRCYGVSAQTLRTLIAEGKLAAHSPTGRKGVLLSVAELERLYADSVRRPAAK